MACSSEISGDVGSRRWRTGSLILERVRYQAIMMTRELLDNQQNDLIHTHAPSPKCRAGGYL